MDKLEEIARRRKAAHTKLRSLKSKVYEAFLHLEEAAFADGALPKKVKELIAVGISVRIDCESCMQWHIEQAAAAGATMREVLEAVVPPRSRLASLLKSSSTSSPVKQTGLRHAQHVAEGSGRDLLAATSGTLRTCLPRAPRW
jgi:AhpD family alkylhydroperoxidase